MPPTSKGPPKLSRATAILLVFQADSQHERITDVYVGLMVCRVESCLYTPDQILDFVTDIEVDLKVARNALKAGGQPRQEMCLFPFCQQLWRCHVNTCNNLAVTCLCCCICRTTLQYMNDDPNQQREYARSHLILPHGAQYKE